MAFLDTLILHMLTIEECTYHLRQLLHESVMAIFQIVEQKVTGQKARLLQALRASNVQ
jgi:hypothetical protein